MANITDSTRKFNGRRYYYLLWVSNKSGVEQLKKRARLNGVLMRVTKGKEPRTGLSGYNVWTRGPHSR